MLARKQVPGLRVSPGRAVEPRPPGSPANCAARRGSSGRGQLSPSVAPLFTPSLLVAAQTLSPAPFCSPSTGGFHPGPAGLEGSRWGRRLLQISARRASALPGACPEMRQGRGAAPSPENACCASADEGAAVSSWGAPTPVWREAALHFWGHPKGSNMAAAFVKSDAHFQFAVSCGPL